MHLLIAEDDATLAAALADCLRAAGHCVDVVADGQAAIDALDRTAVDLLLLDFGLPVVSGAQVLMRARRSARHLPVLLISALDDADARMAQQGLTADAFLTKPFGLSELEQRIAAMTERITPPTRERLSFGRVNFEIAGSDIRVAGQSLDLPPDDRAVLRALLHEGGRPVTREELSQRLARSGAGAASSIDGCVARLRHRLEAYAVGIAQARGLGFCLTNL